MVTNVSGGVTPYRAWRHLPIRSLLVSVLLLVISAVAEPQEALAIRPVRRLFGARQDWGYYIGTLHRGPVFVDEETVAFVAPDDRLLWITLDGEIVSSIETPVQETEVYSLARQAVVRMRDEFFWIRGRDLVPIDAALRVSRDVWYSFDEGLYSTAERSPLARLDTHPTSLFQLPLVSSDGDTVYFVTRDDPYFGTLYSYDVRTRNLTSLAEGIRDVALYGENDLVVYSLQSRHSRLWASEYPGDLRILDGDTGTTILDTDRILYENNAEYSVNSLDVNSSGQVVLFGAFIRVDGASILDGSLRPVILAEIDAR